MSSWLQSAQGRQWIYRVAVAVIALLGVYGVVKSDQAGAIVAVAAALLGVAGPVTALRNLTPDPDEDDGDGQAD